MKPKVALLALLIATVALFATGSAAAQQPDGNFQQPPPRAPIDPLGDVMFPPELIMGHTRELGLTDDQKSFMRAEIQKTSTRFNELQWQLQDSMEALHATMKANPVNEQQALSQLDKVLDAEREIKRLHFSLAIALKNKLTPDQQTKLQELMRRRPENGPGPGGPGRGPGGPPPEGPRGPRPRPGGQPGREEMPGLP